MILNEGKPEHALSKHTPRRSSRRQRSQSALARPKVASSPFKSRVLNPIHLNQVSNGHNAKSNNKEESNAFYEASVASNMKSAEKHRLKKNQYEYQYEKDYHYGPHQNYYQHKRGSEPLSSSSKTNTKNTSSVIDLQSSSSDDDFISSNTSKPKCSKKLPPDPPTRQQILITKNKSLNTKPDVSARTKDLRLKGSDLYVARLGSFNSTPLKRQPPINTNVALPPSPPTESGSLYDELSPLLRSVTPTCVNEATEHRPEIRASRPCYRCVTAMHGVGIKRVFWTNQNGEWEGAKVRDLVEALEVGLEGNGEGEGAGTGQESKGVFVTKHEVLMLKRTMGF